jgi:hypothetical protein
MRFYVPNSNDGDDDDGSRRTVELLHQDIMKHVTLEATGAQVRPRFVSKKVYILMNIAQIVKLESIKCKYPRSTFEITLYDSVFKMHGQVHRRISTAWLELWLNVVACPSRTTSPSNTKISLDSSWFPTLRYRSVHL